MCEIKTVLTVAVLLLAVTGFCIYQAKSEKNVGHHSEIKSESPCEKEYKKYCMNGGDCYYLVEGDIVACNCAWLFGGKRHIVLQERRVATTKKTKTISIFEVSSPPITTKHIRT